MSWAYRDFEDVVKDVTGGNIKTLTSEYLPSGKYPIVDQGKEFLAGYVDDGSRLCKANLPVVLFGDHTKVLKYINFDFCLGADGTKILKPIDGLDEKFLFHFLNSQVLPDAGYSRHFKYLKKLKVPIPPLEEQKRIAAILDKADELRRLRQESIKKLNTLSQSIFFEMFGEVFVSNGGVRIGDFVEVKGGGTPSKARKEFYSGNIPWVSPKDMKSWHIYTSIDKITEEAISESATNLIPTDSILLVNRSGILKHTLPIGLNKIPVAINQDLKALICSKDVRAEFLAFLLKVNQNKILAWVRATTADNFSIDLLKNQRVILPKFEDQDKFCEIIAKLKSVEMNSSLELVELDILFQSLQHRAFNGEL